MRSQHSWTQQIIHTVTTQQHVNKGRWAHIQTTFNCHWHTFISLSINFYLIFLLSLLAIISHNSSEVDTVGDTGHWWVVRVPLLAGWALLQCTRRLPPLPLTRSLAPLPSSGSTQRGRLSLHLILIHWPLSTKISCLRSQSSLSGVYSIQAVLQYLQQEMKLLMLWSSHVFLGGLLTRSGMQWCVWQRLKPFCSGCVLV